VRRFLYLVLLWIAWCALGGSAFSETVRERFRGRDKLTYKVYFNGFSTGTLEWRYLGKDTVNGRSVDVLSINSTTDILQLLNLESEEKVFLDSKTYLPLKVERDIVFFGKKELIKEIYNQRKGYVKIVRSNHNGKEEILYQDRPIHHIMALLCFFPKDLDLKAGNSFNFNLPTYKVTIKMLSEREFSTKNGKRLAYYLVGEGKKKFNLWLDKKDRLPIELEFILPVGKITIVRES
jgi:hypothetical protein